MFFSALSKVPTKLLVTAVFAAAVIILLLNPPVLLAVAWLGFLAWVIVAHAGSKPIGGRAGRMKRALFAAPNDFRAIPGLVEALGHGTDKHKVQAQHDLVGMLPRIQRSHADHFPVSVQRRLIAVVFDSQQLDSELAQSLLTALRMVGHPDAHGDLESIAYKYHWRHSADDPLLKEIAECCEVLRSRAERLEQKSHLLRASAADPNSALLHPAQGLQSEDAEILLRTTEDSMK